MNPIKPNYHYDQVYYVETSDKYPVNPIAIRPEFFESQVSWEDTSKGKVVILGKIETPPYLDEEPPDFIEFTDEVGRHYTLQKMTLALFNEKVKDRVVQPPSFNTDDSLQEFYLKTDFEIY